MQDEPRLPPSLPSKVEKLEIRCDNLMRQNHFLRTELRRWETRWSEFTHIHEELHKDHDELTKKYEDLKKLNLFYFIDSAIKRLFP